MSTPNLPPGAPVPPVAHPHARVQRQGLLERLTPRQRQYALLLTLLCAGVGILWLVFAFSDSDSTAGGARTGSGKPSGVTNIGVMPPGGQVGPLDQWVGTAGRKLAQYETERDEQQRVNQDRRTFEERTMLRFAELEQRLTSAQQAASTPTRAAPTAPTAPATTPPEASLPRQTPSTAAPAMPVGPPPPPSAPPPPPAPTIVRVSLADAARVVANPGNPPGSARQKPAGAATEVATVSTFLPVSFTRGVLLGGLDAPTGGQSQSNPHPVLIRLSDNSVLPNRFRGEYRECFVIAAGYGDISSERAYLRTESLSCVRSDGATLEVRIQGTVYGEDGKVGMRGRLVTKQGQMLANALLAGVVSGIGQGLSTANTTYSSSPLGTTANADSNADAYRAGLGSGIGKALDRLAQYYIKLAENTFPVIEVDAGREIDVVITRGVRIDVPMTEPARAGAPGARFASVQARNQEAYDDADY